MKHLLRNCHLLFFKWFETPTQGHRVCLLTIFQVAENIRVCFKWGHWGFMTGRLNGLGAATAVQQECKAETLLWFPQSGLNKKTNSLRQEKQSAPQVFVREDRLAYSDTLDTPGGSASHNFDKPLPTFCWAAGRCPVHSRSREPAAPRRWRWCWSHPWRRWVPSPGRWACSSSSGPEGEERGLNGCCFHQKVLWKTKQGTGTKLSAFTCEKTFAPIGIWMNQ